MLLLSYVIWSVFFVRYSQLNRGPFMGFHVLLNLLNESWIRAKIESNNRALVFLNFILH